MICANSNGVSYILPTFCLYFDNRKQLTLSMCHLFPQQSFVSVSLMLYFLIDILCMRDCIVLIQFFFLQNVLGQKDSRMDQWTWRSTFSSNIFEWQGKFIRMFRIPHNIVLVFLFFSLLFMQTCLYSPIKEILGETEICCTCVGL